MSLTETLAGWAAALRLGDVPPRVVEFAKSQVLSQLAAARASLGHDLGRRITRAFGPPLQEDPARSAFVLAALTMALDFDDTVYAGHVSHSTVNVPLAYARPLALDGRALLGAVVAANECAARVTAAATLGHFRGQTAAHTHLAGSVAARLHAERAPASRWVDAWGIAFGMPPWALARAFMASDAKVLTAATPVRMGLDACDAEAAGFRGAPDILEHPEGFLARFASLPLPEAVTASLGERWHTETASFKVYPGCAYIDAVVDCAIALHARLEGVPPQDIAEVVVHASLFTVGMDARSASSVRGPESGVSALNFSVAYNVAVALRRGALVPGDFSRERVSDPATWDLAERVRVEHDPLLTRRAILATAPVGEALRQAGAPALEFVRAMLGSAADGLGFPAPSRTFEEAEKAIGARVSVTLAGGRALEESRDIPIGAAGPETRRTHGSLMREKFLSCGGSPAAADALDRLEELGAREVAAAIAAALAP